MGFSGANEVGMAAITNFVVFIGNRVIVVDLSVVVTTFIHAEREHSPQGEGSLFGSSPV